MYKNHNENLDDLLIECEIIKHATEDINKWLDVYGKQGYDWQQDKDIAKYLNRLALAIFFAKQHMQDLREDAGKNFWVE